ncbi:MAG: antibiotic biosynthesis monooxygenase [Candidatus Hydrogenedentota bacterium]
MITTTFRNKLNREFIEEYEELAPRIEALARSMPGFVSIKTFTEDDGERVSLVDFESWETMKAWCANSDHQEAQRLGAARLYTEYSVISFEH